MRRYHQKRAGLSLVELMIAMTVFAMLALSITAAVIQSQQLSQNNIVLNTAYTVAQGYLEQIKTLASVEIDNALADEDGVSLPTKSISAVSGSNIEVDDPIFLDGPDRSLSGKSDGSNHREVLIDLRENDDGSQREVTMDMWVDVDITPVENQSYSHAITVDFEVQLRGGFSRVIGGSLTGLRADINQGS